MSLSAYFNHKPAVFRVTIDERIDESLIRTLVAAPKENTEKVPWDDDTLWTDEKELFICLTNKTENTNKLSPTFFLSVFGATETKHEDRDDTSSLKEMIKEAVGDLPEKTDKDVLWKELQEGQTYLVGQFEVIGSRKKPDTIVVNSKLHDFLRIDQIPTIKNTAASLYSKALIGKETSNAKNDKKR